MRLSEVSAPLTPKDTLALIGTLEAEGYQVTKAPRKEAVRTSILRELAKPGATVKVAVVSDTHLGSVEQQLTHLRDFYRYADDRGASAFIHAGDIVDGSPKMHLDSPHHHFASGFDAQMRYAIDAYPKSANGPTYLIDGNHDTYRSDDATFGEHFVRARPDVQYLGWHSAFVDVGPCRIFVAHGAKGGLSYARSYKIQKLLEQMDTTERADTDVALYGHWHVAAHLPGYQSVEGFLVPCLQRQTRFLKNLGVQPVIGGLILEIEFGARGVWSIRTDWRLYREPIKDDPPGMKT